MQLETGTNLNSATTEGRWSHDRFAGQTDQQRSARSPRSPRSPEFQEQPRSQIFGDKPMLPFNTGRQPRSAPFSVKPPADDFTVTRNAGKQPVINRREIQRERKQQQQPKPIEFKREAPKKPMTGDQSTVNAIWVKSPRPEMNTRAFLYPHFSQFGKVDSVTVERNFAIVKFSKYEEAQAGN